VSCLRTALECGGALAHAKAQRFGSSDEVKVS
jgi:hypothetical protein